MPSANTESASSSMKMQLMVRAKMVSPRCVGATQSSSARCNSQVMRAMKISVRIPATSRRIRVRMIQCFARDEKKRRVCARARST